MPVKPAHGPSDYRHSDAARVIWRKSVIAVAPFKSH
jgi:hypothetical protein